MRFALLFLVFAFSFSLTACKSTPPKTPVARAAVIHQEDEALLPLNDWLPRQEQLSWDYMQLNISPEEPKVTGGPAPVPGIVVGALHKKDPDYYFHWVRDSSHVMARVAEAYELRRPYIDWALLEKEFEDYLKLSQKLQNTKSPYGIGEPRFTITGEADTLPWSRPQYDGPALRALSVLEFQRAAAGTASKRSPAVTLARQILTKDLTYLLGVYEKRGFDVWEEFKADNYHTRMVQLAAFEKGAEWLSKNGGDKGLVPKLKRAAVRLEAWLDDHWDPARGFLRSQLAIVATDGYTAKKTDLDSAVVLAVLEANREKGGHSVLDDRVQATVAVLEGLFRQAYPINARNGVGLAYGRYDGDIYYGGNPWYLITAYYAQFHYRLAARLKQGAQLELTKRNLSFVQSVCPDCRGQAGTAWAVGSAEHKQFTAALLHKGDLILKRFQLHTPADGQLYEQFDKTTGQPASSRGIGWSHSAFLAAVFERQRLLQMR